MPYLSKSLFNTIVRVSFSTKTNVWWWSEIFWMTNFHVWTGHGCIYTWTLLCGQQNIAWKLQSVPANTVPLHVTGTSASTRLTTCHMNQWTGSCFPWGCSSLTFPFEGYRIIQNTNWIVYFFKIIYCGDKWFSGGQIVQFFVKLSQGGCWSTCTLLMFSQY